MLSVRPHADQSKCSKWYFNQNVELNRVESIIYLNKDIDRESRVSGSNDSIRPLSRTSAKLLPRPRSRTSSRRGSVADRTRRLSNDIIILSRRNSSRSSTGIQEELDIHESYEPSNPNEYKDRHMRQDPRFIPGPYTHKIPGYTHRPRRKETIGKGKNKKEKVHEEGYYKSGEMITVYFHEFLPDHPFYIMCNKDSRLVYLMKTAIRKYKKYRTSLPDDQPQPTELESTDVNDWEMKPCDEDGDVEEFFHAMDPQRTVGDYDESIVALFLKVKLTSSARTTLPRDLSRQCSSNVSAMKITIDDEMPRSVELDSLSPWEPFQSMASDETHSSSNAPALQRRYSRSTSLRIIPPWNEIQEIYTSRHRPIKDLLTLIMSGNPHSPNDIESAPAKFLDFYYEDDKLNPISPTTPVGELRETTLILSYRRDEHEQDKEAEPTLCVRVSWKQRIYTFFMQTNETILHLFHKVQVAVQGLDITPAGYDIGYTNCPPLPTMRSMGHLVTTELTLTRKGTSSAEYLATPTEEDMTSIKISRHSSRCTSVIARTNSFDSSKSNSNLPSEHIPIQPGDLADGNEQRLPYGSPDQFRKFDSQITESEIQLHGTANLQITRQSMDAIEAIAQEEQTLTYDVEKITKWGQKISRVLGIGQLPFYDDDAPYLFHGKRTGEGDYNITHSWHLSDIVCVNVNTSSNIEFSITRKNWSWDITTTYYAQDKIQRRRIVSSLKQAAIRYRESRTRKRDVVSAILDDLL